MMCPLPDGMKPGAGHEAVESVGVHLKSLTLRGFKSFASATTLRFEPGITCVVGPNGSGKSNVVDALSWVMGEQGAKSLRGGKMEDVIFAGTTGRAPLGRAEVSLTIDNSDGALPIDYAEVTIRRTMFRNGGSEYALNGDTCRLLDIQELLSDSGIGREMHVIVGQGQLDSVLHADPTGRRAFIEEAAGVLKHRKRKEKALRKLDAMQANLTRVADLTTELRRQLKPLGRQARVARRAAVIQADLRDARLRLLADDIVTVRRALAEEAADEQALRERRALVEGELTAAQQHEALLEQAVAELAPRLARAQETWFQLSALAERVRGTVGLAEQRLRHAVGGQAQAEERRGREPEDLEREAERVRLQEAELSEALESARFALDETSDRRAELERQLAEEENRLKAAARAIADRREGLARLQGQVAAARGRVVSAEAEIGRLAGARDEAEQRAALAQQEYQALREQVDGLEAGDVELEAGAEAAAEELAAAEGELGRIRDEAAGAERERAALRARHEALAPGLRRKDGSGALPAAGIAGVLGPAAELLSVEPGREVAVAAALGAAADAVAVADLAAAVAALAHLREHEAGRAALLIAGASGPGGRPVGGGGPLPDGARWAVELVRVPEELAGAVHGLLERVAVVGGLAEARRLLGERPELTAVTAEGDLLGGGFARGGSGAAPSLLELQAAVDQAAAELARTEVLCAELADGLGRAKERRELHRVRAEETAAARRRVEKERSRVAQDLGRLGGQARGAAGEAERLLASVEQAEQARLTAQEALAELTARLEAAEEAPSDPEPDSGFRDRLAADGANARQTEMEARLAVRTHEERVRSLAGRADGLDRAAAAERAGRERAAARRRQLAVEERVAGAVLAGARSLLRFVEASLLRAEGERAATERDRAGRDAALRVAREHGRGLSGELEKLTDTVHRGEVLGAEKRLRIEQLEAKALEEHGIEAAGLVEEYGPEQPVPASQEPEPEPQPEGEDEESAAVREPAQEREPEPARPFVRAEQERRLKAAEKAHAQLGKVNPLALEEYAALEERHKFLTEQLEDLKNTRRDLLTVIKEVDERVEQVFTAAYHDTAREFEGVFSRLFPGGEGRLVLTDPDDMLTTGVDVEARPPGKKVKRLSLLSGGERSLTAVALLVSIFKARPSPFYVMDEVEAALDETNLRRLVGIMEELRDRSQLIVITHQKLTMESADALYGVTMKGDGISQVISQRLREERRVPGQSAAVPASVGPDSMSGQ
jgi:chromosome segregation protein